MNASTHELLDLDRDERAILAELLESSRTRLLVEIRRTDHRAYREELRQRLVAIESLQQRLPAA